jgi:poly(A) polymerase
MKDAAVKVCKILQDAGHKAVIVGGAIRDILLGIEPHDYDLLTTALPDEVENIFERSIPVGKSFGVIRVIVDSFEFEVATARTESGTSDGRHPDEINYTLSFEEDAKRRDLTINALMYDPITEELLDFVGGLKDIDDGFINFVGDPQKRIEEDHLRILRAIRFILKSDKWFMEPNTTNVCKENIHLIKDISKERIHEEIWKMFETQRTQSINGNRVSHRFGTFGSVIETLDSFGALEIIFPEVFALKTVEQKSKFHQQNAFDHTIMVLNHLPPDASKELVFSALWHDIGKKETQNWNEEKGRFTFFGHENVSMKNAQKAMRDLKFSNDEIKKISWLIINHMRPHTIHQMNISTVRRLLAEEFIEDFISLGIADNLGRICDNSEKNNDWINILEETKNKHLEVKPKPIINGKDLIESGMTASPKFSEILRKVFDAQLEGSIFTKEEAIVFAKTI